jgi:hypothetical protein
VHRLRIVAALALVLAFGMIGAGCGGERVPPPEARATNESLAIAEALGSADAASELERRKETLDAQARSRALAPNLGFGLPPVASPGEDRTLRSIWRMQDRAGDKLFAKTEVDRALDELKLRTPPLHVLQWVLTNLAPYLDTRAERERFYRMSEAEQARQLIPKVEHEVYARVDEDQFYAMSESDREAAVKAFYRDAERRFLKQGIRDFVLVVTPYMPTTEHLPALAIGRDGSASLTPLGRKRPDPSGV